MLEKFKTAQELAEKENNIVNSFTHNWIDIAVVLAIIIIAVVIINLIERKIRNNISKRFPDEKSGIRNKRLTFSSMIAKLLIFVIIIAGIFMILHELNLNIMPLVSTAGVVALIIGFGLPNFVKDIISGISLAFDQQVKLNDKITVGSVKGMVEKINLRSIVIRDSDGIVHYIPNSEIKILSNHSIEWARAMVAVNISCDEATDKIIAILEKIFNDFMAEEKFRNIVLEKPTIREGGGICAIKNSNVALEIICKVKPQYRGSIERLLLRKIKDGFHKEGIKLL